MYNKKIISPDLQLFLDLYDSLDLIILNMCSNVLQILETL